MTIMASLRGWLDSHRSAVRAQHETECHRAEGVELRETNPEHYNLILSYCQAATNDPDAFVAAPADRRPTALR
jgi:hypothetical protein